MVESHCEENAEINGYRYVHRDCFGFDLQCCSQEPQDHTAAYETDQAVPANIVTELHGVAVGWFTHIKKVFSLSIFTIAKANVAVIHSKYALVWVSFFFM